VVNAASFIYIGTDGFTVHFDGFGTEPSADFAGDTVLNGSVLQFNMQSGNSGVRAGKRDCEKASPVAARFNIAARLQLRKAKGSESDTPGYQRRRNACQLCPRSGGA
jgi:hypothetical protein